MIEKMMLMLIVMVKMSRRWVVQTMKSMVVVLTYGIKVRNSTGWRKILGYFLYVLEFRNIICHSSSSLSAME